MIEDARGVVARVLSFPFRPFFRDIEFRFFARVAGREPEVFLEIPQG